MNSTEVDLDGGWHRVHWFGLIELLSGAALAVAALWRTGLPNGVGAWAEEVFGALIGLRAVIAYFRRQYRVTPTVLTWRSGVVFRTEESMRRGDVQSVQTTVPLWYRPLDLMRLVVADGSGNKIEVGPLHRRVAERFQLVMQPAAVEGGDAAADGTATPRGEAVERDSDRSTDSDDVTVGSATSTNTSTVSPLVRRVEVPLWKLVVFSAGDVFALLAAVAAGAAAYFGWWIASIAIVLVWVGVVGNRAVPLTRFRLSIAGDEIRTNQGLFTDQEERTTIERVEFMRVDTTVVGRRLGLERVEVGTGNDTMVIAPVQPLDQWRTLAEVVLGDRAGSGLPIEPISGRSVQRFRLRGAVVTTLATAAAAFWGWVAVLVGVGVGLGTIVWYPKARLNWFGIGGNDQLMLARTGFGPQRRWMFRIDRIDSNQRSVTIGQRRVGLATISFSGRGPASTITIPDVAAETATDWDRRIADRTGPRVEATADRRRVSDEHGFDGPQRSPGSVESDVVGQPLPPAALRFNTFTSVSVAGVLAAVWFGGVGWVLTNRPAESIWRSPWLIGTGSLLVVVGSVWAVWITRRLIRSERWSVDEVFAERRVGTIVHTSTRVKLEHVAVARWAQGPLERRFGLGQVRLFTRGSTNPDLTLAYLDQADARDIAELHRTRSGATDASRTATPD